MVNACLAGQVGRCPARGSLQASGWQDWDQVRWVRHLSKMQNLNEHQNTQQSNNILCNIFLKLKLMQKIVDKISIF